MLRTITPNHSGSPNRNQLMTISRSIALTLRSCAVLALGVAVSGCEKNAVQDITGSLPGAKVKFFNFGVNAPAVNFYANDAKITAVSSTSGAEAVTGVTYGNAGNGAYYSAIDPGQYTFSGRIAAAVDKDLAISNIPGTLADGKSYSIYQSGFYNTTSKSVEGFIIEDDIPATFDYTQALVRFVNAISNSTPTTLNARHQTSGNTVAVGNAIAYKSAGAFTQVPDGIYDLSALVAGATTTSYSRTSVTFVAGRVYTITARGDITVTGSTATNRPFLDNTLNR